MYKPYDIADIQLFLEKHGISWNGFCLNEVSSNSIMYIEIKPLTIDGTKESNEQKNNNPVFIETAGQEKNKKTSVFLEVDNLVFKIYKEKFECCDGYKRSFRDLKLDLSLEWTELLLKKFPSMAFDLAAEIRRKKEAINENTHKEISKLKEQIAAAEAKQAAELKPLIDAERLITTRSANENQRPIG